MYVCMYVASTQKQEKKGKKRQKSQKTFIITHHDT